MFGDSNWNARPGDDEFGESLNFQRCLQHYAIIATKCSLGDADFSKGTKLLGPNVSGSQTGKEVFAVR